jgi:alkylation response protein AidB-like acyl-CoA dehydrogenase
MLPVAHCTTRIVIRVTVCENPPLIERTMAEFRAELHAWLDAHHDELAPRYAPPGTLDEQIAQMQRVKAILFDAGWMRYGWPERVGGLGGSPMLRTEVGAALAGRDLADPGLFSLIEVLAPTLIDFAPAALAADVVPKLLSGAEIWCQGFSEPGTGSDLAALSCRAVPDGSPETAGSWVINGQKVWTSLAQYSDRCVLLTRTGSEESRHRGITAFFVDMDTPGITVSPLEMINGVREFAEVFFDDVVVPADRMLGALHGGWSVAMSILPYERSSCFWQRIAYLYRRLQLLVDAAPSDDVAAAIVGDAYVQLHALRARSRLTQHRLSAGETLGAETSIDKVLVATAEQATYDAARRLLRGVVETDDTAAGEMWRTEYLYSRAATIYGGTAEVQRNIIARRLLDLGGDE